MTMPRLAIVCALVAWGLTTGLPAASAAQSAPPADAQVQSVPQASEPPPVTPAQMERIRRALNQPAGLKLDERQLRFYLEIVARRPTFAEYAKGFDFINGPTRRGNPMSHQEFLQMVTPQEFYSSAGITALDQIQLALTNYIGQSLIRKALEELKQAKSDHEVQAIRERIDRELEALTGARGKPR
jgi:hypothetical protein